MKWKLFFAASINFLLISFPYNIIGCGPSADPYDYYTSFFHNDLSNAEGYKPFYYTGMNFLYEESEPVSTEELIANEWAGHAGKPVTDKDAFNFVMRYPWKDLNNLYMHIEKKQPLAIPDSMKRNSLTNYFINNKDLEGLGYLMYAKKTEVYTGGEYGDWENRKRDTAKMTGLIKNGHQLLKAAKDDFYKLRYAYQLLRLSHYSGRYADVVSIYNENVARNSTKSLLQQLSLSLKAGALFHLNKRKESAYLFSKAFAMSPAKRISNYLGFNWSVYDSVRKVDYLSYCKNNDEKAWMFALFALGNPGDELATMQKIYHLNPAAEVLEILATREINKLEEQYFSNALNREKGGKAFYYYWYDESSKDIYKAAEKETHELQQFLHMLAQDNKVPNPALFENGAAYCAFMLKDFPKANQYLGYAKEMNQSAKLKDQWALTNLLVTINQQSLIDTKFEENLLPSLQWLEGRAKTNEEWKKSYRNLTSEILARKYHKQGDLHKETLAIGVADWIYYASSSEGGGGSTAAYYMRDNLESKDVEKLFSLMENKSPNKFEQYLIKNNSLKKDVVAEFAGTAFLREYNYDMAIKWYKRVTNKKELEISKNPLIDLLYDQEEKLGSEDKFGTTKLAFAEEMKKLLSMAETDKANASKHLYKYALGLYNMTYYGHTWELVQYYRSGSDGYYIPKNASAFAKEYYGCFTAEKYFEKAMNVSEDKNFKAKSLFMMAKCSQKQVHQPQYDEYGSNYDSYDAASKNYWPLFKRNKYFPQLVKDYSTTAFYKTAYSSCSFLRDFVKKK